MADGPVIYYGKKGLINPGSNPLQAPLKPGSSQGSTLGGEENQAESGARYRELDSKLREFLKARAQTLGIAARDWIKEIAERRDIDVEALYNVFEGYTTARDREERVRKGEEYTELFWREVLEKTELGKAVEEARTRVFNEFTKLLNEYRKLKESMALGVESYVKLAPSTSSIKEAPTNQEEVMANVPEETQGQQLTQSSQEEEAVLNELPRKAKVYIDAEIYVVNNWRFHLKIGSKKVSYTPKTPAEAIEIRKKYDVRETREFVVKEMLEKLGLDAKVYSENPVESVEPVPYLYAYLMNKKSFAGLSRERLELGEQRVILRPITVEDYDKLREELGPELSRLGKKIAGALKIEYNSSSDEPFSASREYVFWIEKELPEELIEKALKVIYPKAIELWNKLEAHELLKNMYKADIIPWPDGEYAPHRLLISPTKSGKSGLYYLATGENAINKTTSVSLVGGYESKSGNLFIGKLHERGIAVQIESLETDKASDLAEYLVEYMRTGKARRLVIGRDIGISGTAPLIFTGNPASEGKTGVKLQDWINYGLLRNPEALGSRLLLFYLIDAPRIEEFPEELEERMRIVWEIVRSKYIKRLVAKKWRSPEVEAWLKERDAPIPIPVSLSESLAILLQYLKSLSIFYWKQLKALALQTAIADNLHRLEEISDEELIDEAEKYYAFYKEWLVKSIEVAVSDISKNVYSDINIRVKTWPSLLQKALIGINDILNKRAINSGKTEIPSTEILKTLGEKGLIKLRSSSNPYSSYNIRLKQYMKAKEKELGEIGITLAESTNMVIVDIEAFKGLDIEGLIENLEGK